MDKLRYTVTTLAEHHRQQAKEAIAEMRQRIPRVIKALQICDEYLEQSEQQGRFPPSIDTVTGCLEMEILLSLRKKAAEQIARAELLRQIQNTGEKMT